MTHTLTIGGLAIPYQILPDGKRVMLQEDFDRLMTALRQHQKRVDGMRETIG